MGKQLAAAITKYNDEDPSASIQVIHKDVPTELKEGEVLVRMMLRPINPSDMFCMRGRYGGFAPKQLPAVPGLEGLGIVNKLGPNTGSRVEEGQRVVAVPWPTAGGEGTYQQYVAVPEKDLINPVTAYGFLEVIQVPKGEYLLQQAANSVLGKELISMAQRQGTKTINLVRRHEVVHELKQLGAEEVIVTTDEDVTARVMQITNGKGAWASINPIGGEASRYLPSCTRQGGKVHVFSLFKEEVIVPMFDLHFRQIQWLENLPSDQARQEVFTKVMGFFADGTIKPPHASVKYSLDKAVEAVKKAMDGVGGQGKVMLEDKFAQNEE
ncbi:TPA: hypothetical protein ACH3X2_003820 [Trebouxia sp. C0005]